MPIIISFTSWTRNSVFSLLELSCSESDLAVSRESISSMKTTDGWWTRATAKSARTIFSPSPTHFDVKEDAEIEKKVDFDCEAMHFPGTKKRETALSKKKSYTRYCRYSTSIKKNTSFEYLGVLKKVFKSNMAKDQISKVHDKF